MKELNVNKLILLFSITYMVSYLTRINYGAVVSEMENATGFSKQLLSLGLTGSFITYGVGQIFSGVLGDKFSPKKLIFAGLGVTVLMNILLPFCPSPLFMTIVWSINGLAQAFMWPPLVKLMVALLKEEYNKGVVRVSWGSSIGTIVIYLSAPVIIMFFGWQGVFLFSAVCGIVMMGVWQKFCPEIDGIKKEKETSATIENVKIFTPTFFVVTIGIIICGMLRDGITTWTPSLISESFNMSSASGILSGAVLPVIGMLCYEIALVLYRKKLKNPIICAGVLYMIGVLSGAILVMALNKSSVISVLSIALFNGTMHGVNLMLIAIMPSFYAKTGRVSTVSGVLNAFVYIGSAISTYGIAVLTENFGWTITTFVWLALAILGATICFSVAKGWIKKLS